jgi:hypothetical protein
LKRKFLFQIINHFFFPLSERDEELENKRKSCCDFASEFENGKDVLDLGCMCTFGTARLVDLLVYGLAGQTLRCANAIPESKLWMIIEMK